MSWRSFVLAALVLFIIAVDAVCLYVAATKSDPNPVECNCKCRHRPREIFVDKDGEPKPLTEKEFEELQKRLKGDASRRFPVDAGRIGAMRLDVSKANLESYREFKRTHGEDAEPVANTWGDFSGLAR